MLFDRKFWSIKLADLFDRKFICESTPILHDITRATTNKSCALSLHGCRLSAKLPNAIDLLLSLVSVNDINTVETNSIIHNVVNLCFIFIVYHI